jgi:hypothetical protein
MSTKLQEIDAYPSGDSSGTPTIVMADVAAGSVLVVLAFFDAFAQVGTITDSRGNTWARLRSSSSQTGGVGGSTHFLVDMWSAVNATAGPCTLSLTCGATGAFGETALVFPVALEFGDIQACEDHHNAATDSGTSHLHGTGGVPQTSIGMYLAASMSLDAATITDMTGYTPCTFNGTIRHAWFRDTATLENDTAPFTTSVSTRTRGVLATFPLDEEGAEIPTDDSSTCGCTPADTGTVQDGGVPDAGADPWIQPVIVSPALVCVGGGLVPTQANLVHSEVWWGH